MVRDACPAAITHIGVMSSNKDHINETEALAEARHRSGTTTRPPRVSLFRQMRTLLAPHYDGPPVWLWYTGIARIMILFIVAAGTQQIPEQVVGFSILAAIFMAALTCSVWFLLTLHRGKTVTSGLTWTQVFLDFSVVAATVSFTGGSASFFTFLFVIVILEAGALMGLVQGFVFAFLSTMFLLGQDFPTFGADTAFPYWYNFLIQCLALFSTSVISGYWNQRISRLKQFQREILDNMSSGFLICAPTGRIIAANKVACQVLGMSEQEIINKEVAEVLVCDDDTECPIVTALRNERDYSSYEFRVHTGNGVIRHLGLTTNRLYDPRNRLIALIASFSDLTEIAQMRHTLQRQVRLAAVGESAAELTHEIRNPLASLRSAVEELSACLDSPEMARQLSNIALRESTHLNKIVSGFLNYARNPDLNREALDVEEILEDVKHVTEQATPEISITLQSSPADCAIVGDPTQIRQLFENIVHNSVEAMNRQGTIKITTRQTAQYVEIRVDDKGPGIAPDKISQIFEPFYTEKEKGIGMGLAVCLRIVTAHDGAIQAANRPGGGASIIVRLPVMQQQAESQNSHGE